MSPESRGGPSRRTVLRIGAAIVAGAVADQFPRVPEFLQPSHSTIYFDAIQTEIMKQKKAACIVFGGSNFATAEPLTGWLTPALEPLGGIGSVRYAKNGLDTASLAKELHELKAAGVNEFSFYGSSLGAQVAGQTMEALEALGDHIKIKHIFLDCTPPSMDYLRDRDLAKFINGLPPTGTLTGIGNSLVHRGPFSERGAYAGLWDEQLQTLYDGEYHLYSLANALSHNSTVSLLRPKTYANDVRVDSEAAERRLFDFFPDMKVYPIGGDNQQHGIFELNIPEYHDAIGRAIADAA